MAFINFGKNLINFKIVYYGPAKSGKTTNLEVIHKGIDPLSRGDLTMLSTQQDRTLFFDFLPLECDAIKGFTSKFQLYTVPGQVIYNQTRMLVLQGVDAIVFVADSQWEKMEENLESLGNLDANLQDRCLSLDEIPYVIQFNKRDVDDVAPAHYMDFLLNKREMRVPVTQATAVQCKGVFETLNLVAGMTLIDFARKHDLKMKEVSDNTCVSAA